MVQHPSDKRAFSRVPCSADMLQADSKILLGTLRDVGLHGAFVKSSIPLPLGSVLAVKFALGSGRIQADAEVVRVTGDGMGLRFLNMSRSHSKTLRKYLLDAVGNAAYRDVMELMHGAEATVTKPLTNAEAIKTLLRDSHASQFLLIGEDGARRQEGKSYHVTNDSLGLLGDKPCVFKEGESIFALFTKAYCSYSFPTTVTKVRGGHWELRIPERVLYSERRSGRRDPTPNTVFICALAAGGETTEYEVLDTSDTGLSVRVDSKDSDLWPGVLLLDAAIFSEGGRRTLANAVVQNITRIDNDDGSEWYRVGISHGPKFAASPERKERVSSPAATRLRDRLAEKAKQLVDAGTFLIHDRLLPMLSPSEEEFHVLDLPNASGKPMVGLLNTSWPRSARRVKATVVLITPGFSARKETMGALAYMLVHAFRKAGRDIAVLRTDGVNNVGESYKEPGCNVEGKETLAFTISDGVDDIVGAYAWAESNVVVDPSDIIVLSVSFSSVAVRHALAENRLPGVSLWIPFMGAADAANAIMNVGGHVDGYSNYLKGIKNGNFTLMGCITNAENFFRDLEELKVATFEDSKREIAKIGCDIFWVAGTHDAYMDIRKTRQVMAVPSKGRREIVEVDAGHVPQSSQEAVAEFAIITNTILKHVGVADKAQLAPLGWIGAKTEREWRRVRKTRGSDARQRWWASQYAASDYEGEILEYSGLYQALVKTQSDMIPASATDIADIGCGWGTLTRQLLQREGVRLTAIDLIKEPLAYLERTAANKRLTTVRQSVDGNAVVALRRWIRGEIQDISEATRSLPPEILKQTLWLANLSDARIHMAMRGSDIDVKALGKQLSISKASLDTLNDINAIAQYSLRRIDYPELERRASKAVMASVEKCKLLPFSDSGIDCATCNLVLNFLQRPGDALSEAYRVIKPGGCIVASVYLEDADMSEVYLSLISDLEAQTESLDTASRERLLAAARVFNDYASQVRHFEEEGTFQKFTAGSLSMLLTNAGFNNVTAVETFGTPPRVVVCKAQK